MRVVVDEAEGRVLRLEHQPRDAGVVDGERETGAVADEVLERRVDDAAVGEGDDFATFRQVRQPSRYAVDDILKVFTARRPTQQPGAADVMQ